MVEQEGDDRVKRMRLRYAGTCVRCGTRLPAGTTADYDRERKSVACVTCPAPAAEDAPGSTVGAEAAPPPNVPPAAETETDQPAQAPTLDLVDGVAGDSAQAEFQRRHDKRRERVLTRHPRLGRFLLAVVDDPQSTRAWSVGAEGERVVGEMLAGVASESLRVLNDRGVPGSVANIDHLVVCPTGVYVVDPKRYRDARPELRVEGGLFSPRVELLFVAGRNRTSLVEGVQKQVARVRLALAEHADVPVHGILCFVDADWPLIGGAFQVNDVDVVWPKKLRAMLTAPGTLDEDEIAALQWRLHQQFPPRRSDR